MGANNRVFLTFTVSAKLPAGNEHNITKCDIERFLKEKLSCALPTDDPRMCEVTFNVRRDYKAAVPTTKCSSH